MHTGVSMFATLTLSMMRCLGTRDRPDIKKQSACRSQGSLKEFCGISVCGTSACGILMCGSLVCGPSVCGSCVCGSCVCGSCVCGSSVRGTSVCRATVSEVVCERVKGCHTFFTSVSGRSYFFSCNISLQSTLCRRRFVTEIPVGQISVTGACLFPSDALTTRGTSLIALKSGQ